MVKATLADDSEIHVHTQYRDRDLIKQVPGTKWDANRRVWRAPLAWSVCKALRGVFGDDLEIDETLEGWAYDLVKRRIQPALDLRQREDAEGDPRLFPFQRVGVEFLRTTQRSLLADDMGTGKTVQALVALRDASERTLPALVVCPNSMKRTWEREIQTWFPDAKPVVVTGGAETRRKQIAEVDSSTIAIVNWEAVRLHTRLAPYGSIRLKRCPECGGTENVKASACETHVKELNAIEWQSVIADEAHRLKNPKSKQTRAVWYVAHQPTVCYRFALTGTPIANAIDDAWSILHFIDPHEWSSKTRFLDRYALMTWNLYGGVDTVGIRPDTQDEFYETFDPVFLRRPREVALRDLPRKLPPQERLVEPSPKQKKAYRQLEKEMWAELDSNEPLVATSVITRFTRMLQLASAYGEIDDNGDFYLTEPSSKLDAFEELLEETDEQVVAFAESRQLIELAEKRLEKRRVPFGSVHGGVSEIDRHTAVEGFQNGDKRVLLATLGAGGEGLTLTAAGVICFLQRSFSMVKNRQAEDRVHRYGQTGTVHIVDLITEGTVEEHVVAVARDKELKLEEIVRDKETVKRWLE